MAVPLTTFIAHVADGRQVSGFFDGTICRSRHMIRGGRDLLCGDGADLLDRNGLIARIAWLTVLRRDQTRVTPAPCLWRQFDVADDNSSQLVLTRAGRRRLDA